MLFVKQGKSPNEHWRRNRRAVPGESLGKSAGPRRRAKLVATKRKTRSMVASSNGNFAGSMPYRKHQGSPHLLETGGKGKGRGTRKKKRTKGPAHGKVFEGPPNGERGTKGVKGSTAKKSIGPLSAVSRASIPQDAFWPGGGVLS